MIHVTKGDKVSLASVRTLSTEDRLAIQDLVAQYNRYIDAFQIERLMSLWVAEDPVFDESKLGSPSVTGFEPLRKFFLQEVFDKMERLAHLTGNYLIDEVTGDLARGVCTVFFEGNAKAGGTINVTAYYDDVYERTDVGWKFRSRVVTPYTTPRMTEMPAAD